MADGVVHFAGEDTENSAVYMAVAAPEAEAVTAAAVAAAAVSAAAAAVAVAAAAAEAARMATGGYTGAVGRSGERSWDDNCAQAKEHEEVGRHEEGQRS